MKKRDKAFDISKRKPRIKKVIVGVLIAGLLQFLAVEWVLIGSGRSDAMVRTDYLVILGAGLDGERPKLALLERLKTGLDYLNRYPDVKVIVSGGQGRGESITEAEAMKQYLEAHGISKDRILLENSATSTMENFSFSRALMQMDAGRVPKDITFVTSSFHILRARLLAVRNGFQPHALSCRTPYQVVIQTYVREYLALFKSLLFDHT